jgi:hypothetical protein
MTKAPLNKGGRPTTVTPEATSKLREVFLLDYNVEEACDHAGISTKAYYRRLAKDEGFRGEMERSQRGLSKAAKRVVATEIIVKGNARLAFDFLKHRQPERYRTKVGLDTRDSENGTSVLPAGTVIVLPGAYPHPRIIPENQIGNEDNQTD